MPNLQAQSSREVPCHHRRVGYTRQVRNDNDVPEVDTRQVCKPSQVCTLYVRHGEEKSVYPVIAAELHRFGQGALLGHSLVPFIEYTWPDGEASDGPVP